METKLLTGMNQFRNFNQVEKSELLMSFKMTKGLSGKSSTTETAKLTSVPVNAFHIKPPVLQ